MGTLTRELRTFVAHPYFTTRWWYRELRHHWYLRGRWSIRGHLSRYDACSDIPIATLQILREFLQDTESPYFHCDHTDTVPLVRILIRDGERLQQEYGEIEAWQAWMKQVIDILPYLWD